MTERTKEQQAIAALIENYLSDENLADSTLKATLQELSIELGNGEVEFKIDELLNGLGKKAQFLGLMYPACLDRVDFPLGAEFTVRILQKIDLTDFTWMSKDNYVYPGTILPLVVIVSPLRDDNETYLVIKDTIVGLPLKRWRALINPPEGKEPSVLIWATE